MARVSTVDELQRAYQDAVSYDGSVLVERVIVWAEYTVAILGDKALAPIKLETDHQFYDYDAKYLANDTRYICPCALAKERETELPHLALQALTSLGSPDWRRVGVLADSDGNFYLLEVNTVPGMTGHSLVPMAARAEGMSFNALVLAILQESVRRS